MTDNIIVRILTRIFDLILLNVLFVICSLPVITAGASFTALYSVCLKMVRGEEGYIARGFIKAFRYNFRQSTIIWIILIITGITLVFVLNLSFYMTGVVSIIMTILLGIGLLFYLMEFIFVFPLVARFKNTTVNMLKNAILIPVFRFPYALSVLCLTMSCVILTFLNGTTIIAGAAIWNVVGAALVAFANSFILRVMFEPYENE